MGLYSDILKESSLFSNLNDEQMRRIDAICEERVFNQGEILFEQNAPETELYIVIEGTVEIFYDYATGYSRKTTKASSHTTRPVITFSKGQSFGEVSLVDDGCRTAGARAQVDNTRVLLIWRRKLLLLCNSYPDFGFQVMYNLASDLARRFRRVDSDWRETLLYGTH